MSPGDRGASRGGHERGSTPVSGLSRSATATQRRAEARSCLRGRAGACLRGRRRRRRGGSRVKNVVVPTVRGLLSRSLCKALNVQNLNKNPFPGARSGLHYQDLYAGNTLRGGNLAGDTTLHQLLKQMVEMGASDLHLTTNSPPMV